MRWRKLPALAVVIAGMCSLGADWPGRTLELAASFADATPAQRREILLEVGGPDPDGEALVVRALGDSDLSVRLTAADIAAREHLSAMAVPLGNCLSDSNAEIRAAAAQALGAMGASSQLPQLVRALGDTDAQVRLRAVEAVASLDAPDAAVSLLDRVADPESAVRIAAVRALGDAGDPRATLSLLGAVQDPIPEVRQAAARSLGLLGEARAVRALLSLLRDSVAEVRLSATRALGILGPAGDGAVSDLAAIALREDCMGDPTQCRALARAAVESLGHIGGERASDILAGVFRQSDVEPDIARAAGRALAEIGGIAQSRATALAAAPVPAGLLDALITTLGELGGEPAATALIAIIDSNVSASLHNTALRALGRTGAPSAVVQLLARAADAHTNTGPAVGARLALVRRSMAADAEMAALDGLMAWTSRRGQLDSAALDPLAELLRQPGEGDREAFVHRLGILAHLAGETRNPRAASVLAPLLSSEEGAVRRAALEGMALCGVAGAEDSVASALADLSPDIRLAAADALAKQGDANAIRAILRRWHAPGPLDRVSAVRALGRLSLRTRDLSSEPVLLDALHHGSTALASAALDALADLAAAGDGNASAALAASINDPAFAESASEALGNALLEAPPESSVGLAALLTRHMGSAEPPEVRAAAAWGLGGAGAEAVPSLMEAMDDPRVAVATNAAGALARIAARSPAAVAAVHDGLCAAVAARSNPLTRGNLVVAMARAGVACEGQDPRRMLRTARSPWVRSSAAEVAGVAMRAARDAPAASLLRASLSRCAVDDPVREVAQRCNAILRGHTAARDEDDTIDVLVTRADAPASGVASCGIVLQDGIAREGVTGPAGWIHLRAVPHGSFTVVDPSALMPE